jgi:hypothetical protein
MAVCRGCGEIIDWVKTKSGKNMPLDPAYLSHDEANEGDLLVTDTGVIYCVHKKERMPNVKGRICHFATCKHATEFRKIKE